MNRFYQLYAKHLFWAVKGTRDYPIKAGDGGGGGKTVHNGPRHVWVFLMQWPLKLVEILSNNDK